MAFWCSSDYCQRDPNRIAVLLERAPISLPGEVCRLILLDFHSTAMALRLNVSSISTYPSYELIEWLPWLDIRASSLPNWHWWYRPGLNEIVRFTMFESVAGHRSSLVRRVWLFRSASGCLQSVTLLLFLEHFHLLFVSSFVCASKFVQVD